jgi:hypothetical protein
VPHRGAGSATERDGAIDWDGLWADLTAANGGRVPSKDLLWPEALLMLRGRRRDLLHHIYAGLYAEAAKSDEGRFLLRTLEAEIARGA